MLDVVLERVLRGRAQRDEEAARGDLPVGVCQMGGEPGVGEAAARALPHPRTGQRVKERLLHLGVELRRRRQGPDTGLSRDSSSPCWFTTF